MMRRGVWAWLALTLLAVPAWGPAWAQGASPADPDAAARAAIGECAMRIDARPTGLAQVEQRCPELPSALQAAGIRSLLIASSRDRFDRNSLLALRALLHPAPGAAPDVGKLAPILRELHPPVATTRSWLQRLWDWIVRRFTGKEPPPNNAWLSEIVRQMINARWLWISLIGCALVAVVIAVIVVVVREVRARRGRMDQPAAAPRPGTVAGPADSRLALLRRAPLEQRPAQLFAMLISRLVSAGRLPADRSLTHREVVRRAQLDDPEQHRFIDSLARLSERQIYSGATTLPEGLEEVLARGEDLYTVGWAAPRANE